MYCIYDNKLSFYCLSEEIGIWNLKKLEFRIHWWINVDVMEAYAGNEVEEIYYFELKKRGKIWQCLRAEQESEFQWRKEIESKLLYLLNPRVKDRISYFQSPFHCFFSNFIGISHCNAIVSVRQNRDFENVFLVQCCFHEKLIFAQWHECWSFMDYVWSAVQQPHSRSRPSSIAEEIISRIPPIITGIFCANYPLVLSNEMYYLRGHTFILYEFDDEDYVYWSVHDVSILTLRDSVFESPNLILISVCILIGIWIYSRSPNHCDCADSF